jgi:hypothetical protein
MCCLCCLCVACVLPVCCLCVACVLPVCCLCVGRCQPVTINRSIQPVASPNQPVDSTGRFNWSIQLVARCLLYFALSLCQPVTINRSIQPVASPNQPVDSTGRFNRLPVACFALLFPFALNTQRTIPYVYRLLFQLIIDIFVSWTSLACIVLSFI